MNESSENNQEKYLAGLNEKQKEAVLTTEGPLLILAGAGAGKTKTITHRILHLIKKGAAPSSILAITFTNKAAKEMRERVTDLIQKDKENNLPISSFERPYVSTFHALGVHVLKENCQILGIPRHFAIFDKTDSKRAVKEAMEKVNVDPKQVDPGKIMGMISREKGNFVDVLDYREKAGSDYMPQMAARIWIEYENILKREKAVDFDDLLCKTASLLKKNPEVREHYQKIWKYIHIDEYQDTNKVQYTIAKLLSEKYKNIAVVGDIDQNIYSWRGADIKNILKFEEDYPDAKVILLEENYRSTQTILAVANAIIKKNVHRKEKNLFTKNGEGEKVGLYTAYDEADEANFVGNAARQLIKNGVSPSEIAVLYRANFQSRVLEEAFLTRDIPYQMLGVRFFERKEIKDVLSYLKAALNPDSMSDMKRIINVPARGIGKVTVLKIFEGNESGLPQATAIKINNFRAILKRIEEKTRNSQPSEIIKFIIKESGIEEMYRTGKEEDEEKLENVRELVTLAKRYDGMKSDQNDSNEHNEGIEELLKDAALASDQDSLIKEQSAVKLMTVHASKGLEFDYVFITGLEEGLFPHERMGESSISPEEGEEERRLFYVALTRARKKLYLSYASVRTIFGSTQVNIPSEFVTDIDDEHLESEDKPSGAKAIFIDF